MIAVDRTQIEQKLARRPFSPLFARLADDYSREGRIEEAKELLIAGLEKYPAYPAAHLVLARCYASDGNFTSALGHLRTSVSALPVVDHLLALEADWIERIRESEAPAAVHEPASMAASVGAAGTALAQAPAVIAPVHPLPALERAPMPTAPRLAPMPMFRPQPPRPRTERGRIEDGRIVSKTLAEIYAMQGEYGEAIITYTMLKHQRPHMSAECDLRIGELEQALQAKLNQQKIAVSK